MKLLLSHTHHYYIRFVDRRRMSTWVWKFVWNKKNKKTKTKPKKKTIIALAAIIFIAFKIFRLKWIGQIIFWQKINRYDQNLLQCTYALTHTHTVSTYIHIRHSHEQLYILQYIHSTAQQLNSSTHILCRWMLKRTVLYTFIYNWIHSIHMFSATIQRTVKTIK